MTTIRTFRGLRRGDRILAILPRSEAKDYRHPDGIGVAGLFTRRIAVGEEMVEIEYADGDGHRVRAAYEAALVAVIEEDKES